MSARNNIVSFDEARRARMMRNAASFDYEGTKAASSQSSFSMPGSFERSTRAWRKSCERSEAFVSAHREQLQNKRRFNWSDTVGFSFEDEDSAVKLTRFKSQRAQNRAQKSVDERHARLVQENMQRRESLRQPEYRSYGEGRFARTYDDNVQVREYGRKPRDVEYREYGRGAAPRKVTEVEYKSMRKQKAEEPKRAKVAKSNYKPKDGLERWLRFGRAYSRPVMHKIILSVSAVLLVAMVGVFLYPAAKDYYVSVRENDRLNAEYQAVLDRNDILRDEIETLQTDEGIEDLAREAFGWVKKGETSVAVVGMDENTISAYVPNIPQGSVEAPRSWLTDLLDSFFGIK
ncbi:MAG: septum formation initiator family protein [Eggerthellaceae bacterium]|nr:septum formation initiator family protein [Eggerthellaceae bacterium]